MASTIKCLAVLELLAREPFEFGLSEIGASLNAPKASTHRLVATLMEAGFVEQDGESRRYRLTGKALWVGTGFLRHSRVYHASFPVMEDLAGKTEGMVHLGLWDNDAVLYLHTVGHPSSLYLFADTGERRPVHATALGKVMLAYRTPEDLERIFPVGSSATPKRPSHRPTPCAASWRQFATKDTLLTMKRGCGGCVVLPLPFAITKDKWSPLSA